MRVVNLSSLLEGTISANDYYSDRGELLISKGVVITGRHIELLKKRNIYELYYKPSSEDEEIEHLVSKEIKQLDELQVDDETAEKVEIKTLEPGKKGLERLCRSELCILLDRQLKDKSFSDSPTGSPLSSKATQIQVADRTPSYKNEMTNMYEKALLETKTVLKSLANQETTNAQSIYSIVRQFVNVFVTDKNILLNLSGIKQFKEDYIYHHSLNVCLLAINIAASCGYNENQVIEIGMGALLHDVGMMIIPENIRTSGERLGEEQWYEVQKHPILGLHMLEKLHGMPKSVPYIAYQAHERENGRGYPKRRNSMLIHRFAKLVQIADIFEAMSSPRSYRKALLPYKAMENVIKMAGQGLVSGEYVKAFLKYASLFPVGSLVELSNKSIAKVISANAESYAKPVVSVLVDKNGMPLKRNEIYQIDLCKDSSVSIARAVPSDFIKFATIMDGF